MDLLYSHFISGKQIDFLDGFAVFMSGEVVRSKIPVNPVYWLQVRCGDQSQRDLCVLVGCTDKPSKLTLGDQRNLPKSLRNNRFSLWLKGAKLPLGQRTLDYLRQG